MPLKSFIIYTTAGALLWNIILATLGYYFPKELMERYYHEINIAMITAGILFGAYLLYQGIFGKKVKNAMPEQDSCY
jgi:membrane protein DedA with SNARE-associated domain